MNDLHAKARAAEAQQLALLAEHLLARAAFWEGAGPDYRARAEDLRMAAQHARVQAATALGQTASEAS